MDNDRVQLVHEGRLPALALELVPGACGGSCREGAHVQQGGVQQRRLQLAAQSLLGQLFSICSSSLKTQEGAKRLGPWRPVC